MNEKIPLLRNMRRHVSKMIKIKIKKERGAGLRRLAFLPLNTHPSLSLLFLSYRKATGPWGFKKIV